MNLSSYKKGVLMLIGSAFAFSLMSLFVRLSGDLPSAQKAFFRNFIAAIAAAIMIIKNGERVEIKKGDLPYLLIRSFFGTTGVLLNFYAIDKLMLADANILNKMSPFFAVLASAVFLREKTKPYQYAAVITALIGSIFIIKPSFSNVALFPAIAGLLGGLAAGLAYTTVRYLGQRGVKGPVIVLFFSTFSSVVLLPLMIANYKPMSFYQMAMLIGAGVSATFGQFLVTGAYIHAPANEISIFDYTTIVFSTVWGLIFFNQIPDIFSFMGYAIIFGAAFYNFRRKLKENQKIETAK
ncbi:MAG: DMT family transporter [Firmicutes bacterium]|nr:DMT family transporter [Bacillota bacterium]